jgi:arylsulfatase A-like enzyme
MDEVFDRVRCVRTKEWHYIRNFAPRLPWATCHTYMEQQPVMGVMRQKWAGGTLSEAEQTFFKDHKPTEELYNAETDPDCMHNVAEDPANAEIIRDMRNRLDQHLSEVNDLGEVTEEDLIQNGILTNRLDEYRNRKADRPSVPAPGPDDFPVTLQDARTVGLVD